ncbi:unnamed protein product [Bursaphelenchus xylophilus]|uniref:(pine wood nematode) hypothetical protein n=1 Tax=Bursaphelenchus xylophilus TaxID=6326 RepID=A0A1I7RLH1_BURXY|nr:unnamed protein product [Bursaphelenchus xylophilus]CAG9082992.1 unnamed protein product [Bursaphelenchus xylophilus]
MSAQVEQPVQPAAAPEEPKVENGANGEANGSNGEAKPEESKESKKEKEVPVPIDPKEDFVGWVGQQIPNAIHKFNFYILQWAINLAYEDETKRPKLPPNEEVTKSQFLNYLKDGQILAHLANKLHPSSVENVKEGEEAKTKEAQKENIEGFIKFAKEKAELNETQVFSADDLLEKGKAGFSQVLNTLFQLAHVAQTKFQQQGIDVDTVITEIAGIAPKSIIEKIRTFVFNKLRRQSSTQEKEKEEAKEEEKKEEQPQETAEPAPVTEEKKEEAPAVTAQ